jgi:pimeloyl-ACP methyl ester carboxylesterase
LSIQALVLQGENDPIPLEATRELAEILETELHPLPRCGHVPYIEAFEEFKRLLNRFLPAD